MAEIIVLNDYRREHGIALPRSPYYTLKATKRDLDMALERAAKMMNEPLDKQGLLPYAVIVGYENKKTGDIKLLTGCSRTRKRLSQWLACEDITALA